MGILGSLASLLNGLLGPLVMDIIYAPQLLVEAISRLLKKIF